MMQEWRLLCCVVLGIALGPLNESAESAPAAQELLLFGDDDHGEFIGCLSCGRFAQASVCNRYGEHGSRYSNGSIWNRYGEYGSRYSDSSPWNRYASAPPVIVDRSGNFYGYFTANTYHRDRTRIEALVYVLDNVHEIGLDAARDLLCD